MSSRSWRPRFPIQAAVVWLGATLAALSMDAQSLKDRSDAELLQIATSNYRIAAANSNDQIDRKPLRRRYT